MTKREAITVIVATALLASVVLLSQADAKTASPPVAGGVYRTQTMAQWELYKYKMVTLPKRYPYCFAPWTSYVLIDKYVKVDADNTHNLLVIDPALYERVKPEADENLSRARTILKKYKVRGRGKSAYLKIGRYVKRGKYIKGVKSASGFFRYHGGDCAAHAAAVYVLCKAQGIPVRYCIGSLEGSCHAWNRVKLGRKWYWADETMEMWLSRSLWEGYKKPMEMW